VLHNPVADAWVRSLRRVGDITVRLRRLHPTAAPCASLAVLDAWASHGAKERLSLDGDDLDGDDLLGHVGRALDGRTSGAPLTVDVRGVPPDPAATRAAFGAYAWDAALRGAVACLACDPGDPDMAMLAGLSAHYLAPHDARVSCWAAKHFVIVRARTSSAAMRSHACYRLAVHAAKYGGDAREPAEASRDAARAVPRARGPGGITSRGRTTHWPWSRGARGMGPGRWPRSSAPWSASQSSTRASPPPAVEQTASHLAANLLRARSLR
jgi:hypothetical protein